MGITQVATSATSPALPIVGTTTVIPSPAGNLPNLDITSEPLEFLDDIPTPFLPDVLKIRARVINKGVVKGENVVVKVFLGDPDDGGIGIGTSEAPDPITIEPGKGRSIDVVCEFPSNVENGIIYARAYPIGQEDADFTDNTISQNLSFYFVDFRHDKDAFWFENWYFENFGDFRDEFTEFLRSQLKEKRYAVFVTTLATPWLFGLLYKDGHCYGMAMGSTLWKVSPEMKPVPKETYQMSFEEAKSDILFYHWQMPLYLLSEGLWELPPVLYSAEEEYNELLQAIKDKGEPIVVGLSQWPPGEGHAVAAYKILDLGNEKRVYVYDNEIPLKDKRYDSYVTFRTSLNEANYIGFNRAFAVPLDILREDMTRILSQLISEKIKEWWNNKIMLFRLKSPITSLITDQYGRRVGYVDGTFINEIPSAEMEQQLDSQLFYLPLDLTYTIDMTGTETGVAGIDIIMPTSESRARVAVFEDIPFSAGSEASTTLSATDVTYEVVLDTGEIIKPKNAGEIDASDIIPPELPPEGVPEFGIGVFIITSISVILYLFTKRRIRNSRLLQSDE